MATMKEISEQIRAAGIAAEQVDTSVNLDENEIDKALPGGVAEKMKPEDFDPEQLKIGTDIEYEHTPDRAVAENIAMDHLAEDPDYYKKLQEMEKKGVDKATFSRFAAREKA